MDRKERIALATQTAAVRIKAIMKPLTVRPGLVTLIGLRTLVPRYAKVPATATRTIANTVASLLPYETQPP